MKTSSTITFAAQLVLALAVAARAQDAATELKVNAQMDIYRAAGYNDGSDGTAPAVYVFPAGEGRVLEFADVSGKWTCSATGVVPFGSDGTSASGCNPLASFGSVGPFSGYSDTDFSSNMVGMFLEDGVPATPPPALRFWILDNSYGGIETNFSILRPLLGQIFFIGDGLTGTGSGVAQLFVIPPTATHLYLGYIGSCVPGDLAPSCYSDNAGTLTARLRIGRQSAISN
jgi:hypothetical protein